MQTSLPATINFLEVITQLSWGESEDLEFKSAKGGLPKSLWETYSAMANTQGGIILLGVENDGTISGVSDSARLKKSFWDTINNQGKISANLLSDQDLDEVLYEGKRLLVIRIPQAGRYQRPVYINQNPLTGTYRRNHEGDYRCTEQEVSRMFSDRAEEPADSRILENFDLADIDIDSLKQYRQRFASHKPNHQWLSQDDKGLLVKLGGWRQDRKTKQEGLTVAGILMFGREESIREAIPTYHVDYQEKLSADPTIRWTDRLTVDGTWNANLFQFYLRAIQRLSADLKLPFQLETDLLRKGETEVHEAIREALVNALIHADYQGVGGVRVEKHPDRFSFANPGTLLVSREQLWRGGVSECRNKSLQTMFMLFGAAEKAGSGIDKIRKGWTSQHWRMPDVQEQIKPDRVYWQLLMVSLIPEDSLKRLGDYFGAQFEKFSQLEVQALVTADVEGAVDNARMRQITNRHATDMTRLLQGLVAKKALTQEGQARGSRYRLPTKQDFEQTDYESNNSVHNGIHSVHNGIHSVHNGIHSVHNGIHSVHNGIHSVHNGEFDAEELTVLHEIAKPAKENKRLAPKKMGRIIQELCEGRWLSRKQLAELLDRNPDSLRARFLTQMVEHHTLRLRYPDKPNRADQAYSCRKTNEEGELE